MGMSASQARLLTITARKSDIELKSQQISNAKMRLANESEAVSTKYTDALNNQTLTVRTSGENGFEFATANLDNLLSNGYSIKTAAGKDIAKPSSTQERLNFLDINNLPEGYSVETKGGVKLEGIESSMPDSLSDFYGQSENGIMDAAKLGEPYCTDIINAIDAAIDIIEGEGTSDKKYSELNHLARTNNGKNDSGEEHITARYSYDDNNISNGIIGRTLSYCYADESGGYSTVGGTDSENALGRLQAMKSAILSQQAMNQLSNAEDAGPNNNALGAGVESGNYVIKDEDGNALTLDQVYALNSEDSSVNIGDQNLAEALKGNNNNYLIQGLLMGEFVLFDKEGKQVSLSSNNNFQTSYDTSDDARAEAEFNASMQKINNKEKKLDMELKNLDTEHSALDTEYDSIKSVIDKNIETSFKMFS